MGVELDASFNIGIAIGDKLEDIEKALRKEPPRPIFLPFTKGGTGTGVVRFGHPPTGRVWNILTLTLLGNDDHTTVTGTGALYVDCDADTLSTMQCVIPALPIPTFNSISSRTLWAHSTGDVAVNFVGVAGGTEVIAKITVAEWREQDISQVYTN